MISKPIYRLTLAAQSDLIEINQYTLNQWGVDQSKKYLSELRQTINALTKSPNIGKHRKDVGADIYSYSHASHVIYYTQSEKSLVIFAVLHKRMVPLLHLVDRNTI